MKILKHPYTLVFKENLGKREGVLLQVQFSNGFIGYADCHPWPDLGDLPLSEQLTLLASGKTTPLTRRSLYFAEIDAEARSRGLSLFSDQIIPQSHFLVPSLKEWKEDVQGVIKIKITKEKELLKAFLADHPVRVRLDFNAKISKKEFVQFLDGIPLDRIDCIEDPFRYSREDWKEIQQCYPIALACDAESEKAVNCEESARFLVLKPAKQSEKSFLKCSQKLIVTTYLDHPFGQMCAAYIAAKLADRTTLCGLLSHLVYQPNAFSSQLAIEGNVLVPPAGTGFGFDQVLKECDWHAV